MKGSYMIPWSSTYAACEERIKKMRQNFLIRIFFAITIPFIATAIQFEIWSTVRPFFWFMFYPSVFLSAWFGGFTTGFISTVLSAVLAGYFFVPPEFSFERPELQYILAQLSFFVMGSLISILIGRLKQIIRLQKQGQVDLFRRKSQLQEAQRIGKFGSWAWDLRRNYIEWSDQTYRLFGLVPRQVEITYEIFLERVHPGDREMLVKVMNETLSTGKPYSLEYRICLLDGTERIVQSVADAYLENGKVTEIIGTVLDITEKKQAEKILKESENKFRGLLETACDPVVIIDARGNIEFANQQLKSTFGYDHEEIIGKPIEILVPERFKAAHIGKRMGYMDCPTSRTMGRNLQILARKKDGTDFPVDISLSPINTKRGTVVTAFIRDMSGRKRIEARERFLFDTARVLSETTNYQERIQRIADLVVPPLADICLIHIFEEDKLKLKAVAQRKNLDSLLLIQAFSNEFLHKKNLYFGPGFVANSEQEQLIDRVKDDILMQIVDNDASRFDKLKNLDIQSLISIPMYARGRKIGVATFVRCKPLSYTKDDLEFVNLVADRAALAMDNARLYQETQKAVQLREDVLAIVSHDLKNPLGVVKGYNKIIADKLTLMGANLHNTEATDAIERSVHQMERLIGDLLDFAKIQSGVLSIDAKPCSVSGLVWGSVENIKYEANKKNIHIHVDIQSELPEVFCDADRIAQVLFNLLGNAIKFSPEQGFLKICAARRLSDVEITIADEGNGISQESLPHIFDRYWQVKETAKLGTGLGLSIAKGIVLSHHGQIWAESTLGEGAIFHFTLPISKEKSHSYATNEINQKW